MDRPGSVSTKPGSAGAAGAQGDTPGRGVPGRSLQNAPLPWGLQACFPLPTPTNPSWEVELGPSLGAGWGYTYASWEFLYFCMTPWNRPLGPEADKFSGGTVDLEGAGQE